MSAYGKTALLVISLQNFRDEELNHPREILIKVGVLVSIVSTKRGEATGMLGHVEQVD